MNKSLLAILIIAAFAVSEARIVSSGVQRINGAKQVLKAHVVSNLCFCSYGYHYPSDSAYSLLSFLSAPSATASSTTASTSSSTSSFKAVFSAAAPTCAPRLSPTPPRRPSLASATCFATPSACTSPFFHFPELLPFPPRCSFSRPVG